MIDLPPLNALRAFEAAARHLSVKAAADELHVTPGAVSQMLKLLEDRLGTKLFRRANRAIFLTDAGQGYLPPVRNAFRQITEATARVATSVETGVLTVSVTPFFAASWLVPRLGAFSAAHPEIDLRILTGNNLVDFARENVDVAVRHGLGRYPGLASDRLLTVEVVPVATPALVKRYGRPKRAADLAAFPRVHDAERKGWHLWFAAHAVDTPAAARGPSFDDSSLLLQAVQAGQGAGLLPSAMVADDIKARRLVRLAEDALLERFAYYLLVPESTHARPKVAAFRKWILAAAKT